TAWHSLGLWPTSEVHALVSFDDGSGGGPKLFAGGSMGADVMGNSTIGSWNGTSWSSVGGGTNELVSALAVYDSGTGPRLYAGGRFTNAGGAAANRIARWNGVNWSNVGSGVTATAVYVLATHDDGTGAGLR